MGLSPKKWLNDIFILLCLWIFCRQLWQYSWDWKKWKSVGVKFSESVRNSHSKDHIFLRHVLKNVLELECWGITPVNTCYAYQSRTLRLTHIVTNKTYLLWWFFLSPVARNSWHHLYSISHKIRTSLQSQWCCQWFLILWSKHFCFLS